jgi:hypothetical protein
MSKGKTIQGAKAGCTTNDISIREIVEGTKSGN